MEKDTRIQEGWRRIREYRRDGEGYENTGGMEKDKRIQEGWRSIREYRRDGEG